jgi:hypothetical protein
MAIRKINSTFGTWNARTLYNTGAIITWLLHLKQSRIGTIVLQAIKYKVAGEGHNGNEITLLYSTRNQRVWGGMCGRIVP